MGVSYLLDTHVFLWLLGDPSRVPASVKDHLAVRSSTLWVSAASAMEVATKTRLGTLPDVGIVATWSKAVAGLDAEELPISTEHALAAGSLDWSHRDPFDRLLAAQATLEGCTLVTVDRIFTVPQLLTW